VCGRGESAPARADMVPNTVRADMVPNTVQHDMVPKTVERHSCTRCPEAVQLFLHPPAGPSPHPKARRVNCRLFHTADSLASEVLVALNMQPRDSADWARNTQTWVENGVMGRRYKMSPQTDDCASHKVFAKVTSQSLRQSHLTKSSPKSSHKVFAKVISQSLRQSQALPAQCDPAQCDAAQCVEEEFSA